MNLTRRLSLTHGFIALLAVAVTLAVILVAAYRFFHDDVRESQNARMKAFALAARESYFTNDDVAVLDFIRLTSKDPMVVFAAFQDGNVKTRVLPGSFKDVDLAAGKRVLPDGLQAEVFSSPVKAGGKTIGTVAIAYNAGKLEAAVQSEVNRWMGLTALAGACALAVAFILSVLLSKTLVTPLKRIKTGTDQVRAGRLDKLVEVERSDEIGALARAFNDMVLQLKELDGMKRDFIAGVTHDFGIPLHAIKNALELLEEGTAGPLTPQQSEYLLMISNNLNQLNAFIGNLLTASRIEAAKAEPFYEAVDSLALAREIAALYQPEAQKKGLELRLLNQEASMIMVTDTVMFRQILTNLVSNALKYTLRGGISIHLSKGDGFSTLQVSDTGIGIDPQHQRFVFDKFYRVRQGKNFPVRPGSGLGLSISKGLAEAMDGSILLESQPGKGSTFTVKLLQRRPTLSQESFQPGEWAENNGKKPSGGNGSNPESLVKEKPERESNPPSVETTLLGQKMDGSRKKTEKKQSLPGEVRAWPIHYKQH